MSQEQLQGQFRQPVSGTAGLNLFDAEVGPPGGWSAGTQLIDQVGVSPALTNAWEITSWSVQCQIAVLGSGTQYGRLGKLLTSPLVAGVTPTIIPQTPIGVGNLIPFLGIPASALALLQTIWDGQQDPAPPIITGSAIPAGQGVLAASYVLPEPISLRSGDEFGIGLWLLPSLASNVTTVVTNASWVICYDVQQQ